MKILIFISILFLASCSHTYYWYSAEAEQTLSRMSLWTSSGRTYDPVKTLPDGTRYTMLCYSAKGDAGYLWKDKMLVKKEKTPKEWVKLNKESNRILKRVDRLLDK
jgi:hypothetical protein